MEAERGQPLVLEGDPFTRGLAQAALRPGRVEAVRDAVRLRLGEVRTSLLRRSILTYLGEQSLFAGRFCVPEMSELRGIANGFALNIKDLFAYLHAGIISDITSGEGCTAWGKTLGRGAILAKNRDFRGEHRGIQEVFLHRSRSIAGGAMLCVGSLGAPGCYSSGINGSGFALVDTAVGAKDHHVGWLRYFLMTRLLSSCATVEEALAFIAEARHAAGGNLVLADRRGAVAAVELRSDGPVIERGAVLARTNHFGDTPSVEVGDDPMAVTSRARLVTINAWLEDRERVDLDGAAGIMASHSRPGFEGLCRHGEDGDSRTLSTSLYLTDPPALYFAPGNPCEARWQVYRLGAGEGSAAGG